MKKLAIMQPYIFPYIGYYQLINCVDKFIFLDDVNFIKRGWINRNQISKTGMFSIPLKKASQNKLICDTYIHEQYDKWKEKFKKNIAHVYGKALNYKTCSALIYGILDNYGADDLIGSLCKESITAICDYLDIRTEIIPSSATYNNRELKGQDRIIDICNQEKTDIYLNAMGGKKIYNGEIFKKQKLNLKFIELLSQEPYLSIIDTIMFNDKKSIMRMMTNYKEFE